MKKILKYIAAALILPALAGCSNDMFDGPIEEMPEDGRLTIRYVVPEMQAVATRGVKENVIKDLTLLIFNSSGDLMQVEDVADLGDGTSGQFSITVDEKIRKDKGLSFMMIANAPSAYNKTYFDGLAAAATKTKNTTIIALPINDITVSGTGTDRNMIMTGKQTLSNVLNFNSMALYRNAAKTSVHMVQKNEAGAPLTNGDGTYMLYTAVVPFQHYGNATQSALFSGADNTKLGTQPTTVTAAATVTNTQAVYYHPTKNQGRAFVIVKTRPAGDTKDYYYRLDYKNATGILDLLPNHHYQFAILNVSGKGYETVADAVKNPISLNAGAIEWNVYDHSPMTMNMVTDGVNYLGVSHEVKVSGNVTSAMATKVETFYVRVSNKNNNYPTTILGSANFIVDKPTWMSIGNIDLVDDDDNNQGSPIETDGEIESITHHTDGYLYKVELQVRYNSQTPPGSQTGKITVNWNGLTRDIPVTWDRSFDSSDIIKVAAMTAKEGTTTKFSMADYFASIVDDEESLRHGIVWGIGEQDNNGHDRSDGFHFPIMYGTASSTGTVDNPWTYEYAVTLKNQTDNDYIWDVIVDPTSPALIKDNLTIEWDASASTTTLNGETYATSLKTDGDTGPKFKMTFNSKAAGWEYASGNIIVRVAPQGTTEWTEIPLKVYHTGFFHKDDYKHAVEGTYDSSRTYTYYEVVNIDGEYWLDRNLGAHSAELYIERGNGGVQYGRPTEGSNYYYGAYYYIGKQESRALTLYADICPPAFQIPYDSDYETLRRSASFRTDDMGYYNTAHAITKARYSDGTTKLAYFPKARFYDAGSKMGDSLAGYYWTQTTATGFEKDEIGRWVKGFMILGESTLLNNSRIDYNSVEHNGYAMQLRAVRKHAKSETNGEAGFFVTGATHVFVYSEGPNAVPSERVFLTSWPGVAIADANTADMGYMNYIYTGPTPAENLKVIFNYKGANGSITSISKDGTTAKITNNVSPENLEGWRFKGDVAPNGGSVHTEKVVSGSSSITKNVTAEPVTDINTTASKYYWNIRRDDKADVYLSTDELFIEKPENFIYQIHGNIFTGAWNTDASKVQLIKKAGTNDVWEVTVNVGNGGEFVIQKMNGATEVAVYKNDVTITPGTEVTLSTTGSANVKIGKGNFTFSFNSSTGKLLVTGVESDDLLYQIRGNFETDWKNYNLKKESGKWILKDQVVTKDDAAFGIRRTISSNTEQQDAWIGSTTGATTVALGTAYSTSDNSEGANGSKGDFKIAKKGTYTFTYDPSANTITVTGTPDADDPTLSGLKFGIRGQLFDGSNWTTKMMKDPTGTGKWELKGVAVQANKQFGIGGYESDDDGIADRNQNIWYEGASGSSATVTIGTARTVEATTNGVKLQIGTAGTYDFLFDEIAKTLTVTKSEGGGGGSELDNPIPSGQGRIVLYMKPGTNWSKVALEVENGSNSKSGWGEGLTSIGTTSDGSTIYYKNVDKTVWNVNVNNGSDKNLWCNIGTIGEGNTVYIEFDNNGATKRSGAKTVRRRNR